MGIFCTFFKFSLQINPDALKQIWHQNNPKIYPGYWFGAIEMLHRWELEKWTNQNFVFIFQCLQKTPLKTASPPPIFKIWYYAINTYIKIYIVYWPTRNWNFEFFLVGNHISKWFFIHLCSTLVQRDTVNHRVTPALTSISIVFCIASILVLQLLKGHSLFAQKGGKLNVFR